jgi:hypothetical protein
MGGYDDQNDQTQREAKEEHIACKLMVALQPQETTHK